MMVVSSLRSYLDYIEDRLNRDAFPEVVAQCRHILEQFPRNLETYRLLVRAIVSQQNYTDGLDLSQRIHAVNPNDFIAHVAISECYRESGSLGPALWHLQRAFEQVPSDESIQDEMKSLYMAQGKQPPRKFRLTSGALARLYSRGRLYPQAIKELEKGIASDQDRLDLQILLASVLWESRYEIRAGRLAAEIFKKLPFSIDANRILASTWLKAGNKNEARPYIERVREIDPYLAYEIENNGQKAPDEIVNITRLDYSFERETSHSESADWVSQISAVDVSDAAGIRPPADYQPTPETTSGDTSDLPTPDWLAKALHAPVTGPLGDIDEPKFDDLLKGDEVPKSESISESVRAGQTGWLDNLFNELPPDEAGNAPVPASGTGATNTPDWLSGVLNESQEPAAPEFDPIPSPPPPMGEETIDWISDIQGSETSQVPYTDATEIAGGTTPLWLKEAIQDQKQDSPPPSDEDSNEWLNNLIKTEDESFEFGAIETPPESFSKSDPSFDDVEAEPEMTFSALEGLPEDSHLTTSSPEDDIPDWMQDQLGITDTLNEATNEQPVDPLESTTSDEDVPTWLADLDSKKEDEGTSTRPLNEPIPEQDKVPSFDLAELFSGEADTQEDDEVSTPYDDSLNEEENPETLDIDWDSEEDAMAWLEGLASDLDPNFTGSSETTEEEPVEEIDLDSLIGDEVDAITSEADASEAMPDWLSSPASTIETETTEGDEDPFKWLDSEMEKQGFSSETPVSEAAEPDIPPVRPSGVTVDATAAPASDDDLPEWLKEIEEKSPADDAGISEVPVEEDELAWLDESLANAPRIDTDELSAIFDEPEESAAAAKPVEEKEEEIPDWLFETTGVGMKPEEIEADAVTIEEDSDLPAWLKSTPEEDGAEPVTVVVEDTPAPDLGLESSEDIPDWLSSISEPEPEPIEAEADDVPEWLKEPAGAEAEAIEEALPDWLTADADEAKTVTEETVLADLTQEVVIEPPVIEAAEPVAAIEPEHVKLDTAPLVAPEIPVEVVPETPAEPEPEVADVIPDWMLEMESDLTKTEEEPPVKAEPVAEPVATADSDLPDWLAEIKYEEEPEPTIISEAEVEAVDETPDWLSDFVEETPVTETPGEEPVTAGVEDTADEELPDWLADLSEEPAGEPLVIETVESDEPDWLKDIATPEEAAVAEVKAEPEPMPRAEPVEEPVVEEEPVFEAVEESPAAPAEEDIPDWLKIDDEELPAAEVAEDLDWLTKEEPVVEEAQSDVAAVFEPEPAPEPEPTPVVEPEPAAAVEPAPEPDTFTEPETVAAVEPTTPTEPEPVVTEPERVIEEPVIAEPEPVTAPAEVAIPGPAQTTSILVQEAAPAASGSDLIETARSLMAEGEKDSSLNSYEQAVRESIALDTVIEDMEALIAKGPVKPKVYRLLGDAFMTKGDLQKALKMYHNALDQL